MHCDLSKSKKSSMENLVIWISNENYTAWTKSNAKWWLKSF